MQMTIMALGHKRVRNMVWVRLSLEEIKYCQSSATQDAMRSEFSGKWRAECLNTRLPLPTLHVEQEKYFIL